MNKLDTWIIMSSPEGYRKGAHTLLDIQYHYVWKTKYGYRVLEKQIGQRLRSIILEIGNLRMKCQLLKGKRSYIYQREFPELKKRNWGQYLWARGYFCSTVGVVTEEIVKKYIEEQEEDDNFKIRDKDLFLN